MDLVLCPCCTETTIDPSVIVCPDCQTETDLRPGTYVLATGTPITIRQIDILAWTAARDQRTRDTATPTAPGAWLLLLVDARRIRTCWRLAGRACSYCPIVGADRCGQCRGTGIFPGGLVRVAVTDSPIALPAGFAWPTSEAVASLIRDITPALDSTRELS